MPSLMDVLIWVAPYLKIDDNKQLKGMGKKFSEVPALALFGSQGHGPHIAIIAGVLAFQALIGWWFMIIHLFILFFISCGRF
jgi:hypothetical protein